MNWLLCEEAQLLRELRNLDLNLLIVFRALAEHEHLTRAAEKLHMSQPAVSNALARLRQNFNDELFVRAPQGMSLTPRAQELRAPIEQALNLIYAQLLPEDSFDCKVATKRFAVSVNGYAEVVGLPDIIRKMRVEAPNISLDVMPESDIHTPELLRKGELDLAIDYLPIPGKDLIEEAFSEEELVVVAGKNNSQIGEKMTLDLYRSLPHAVVRPRNHKGSHTEIVLGRKKVKRNVAVSLCNLISLAQVVIDSDLICTLPRRLAEHQARYLPIEIYPLPIALEPLPVYMTYHRDKYKDQGHRWLREKIKAGI